MRRAADGLAAWLLVGAIGWAGIAWIGWLLWQSTPPRAGFDLALLLDAARRVTAGQSPYDPAMLAGTSPAATSLFYSYPPPVAQAMTLLAWLPDGVVLVLWGILATLGLALTAWRLAIAAGRPAPGADALRAAAVASFLLPFSVAVLFGNLDAFYPVLYGGLLLAILPGASRTMQLAGGVAVALATVAKLHPAPLLLWLAVRAARSRSGAEARALGAAVVAGLAVVMASLIVGGTGPWLDYVAVVRSAGGASLVDPRNARPVSLIGLVLGLDGPVLVGLQVVVVGAVVVVTLLAGARVRDPLASFAIVAAASLVTLPITWYHYLGALIPVAIALAARYPATRMLLALAGAVAGLAMAFLPLMWIAVAVLIVVACRQPEGWAKTGRTLPVTP